MFTYVKLCLCLFIWGFTLRASAVTPSFYCGTSFVEGPTLAAEKITFRTFGKDTAKRSVLLLHGMDAHGGAWKPLIQEFDKDDVFLIAPNLRGHGGTPALDNHYHLWSIAREMRNWFKVQFPNRKVEVVGHSLGGRLAVAMAFLYPEIFHSLTVLDLGIGSFESLELTRIYKKIHEQNEGRRPHDSPGYRMMLQSWIEDLTPALESLKLPVQLVGGDLATVEPKETCTHFGDFEAIQMTRIKPEVAIHRIRGSGHLLHRTHPAELKTLLINFWGAAAVSTASNH